MKINLNSRNVLFRELKGDQYGLKALPQDSAKYFLDVGAAYGLISILARLLHPQMKIMAVEPHAETYADLVANVDHMQILTLNAALGTGAMFYLEKERKMKLCNSFGPEEKNTRAIQSFTLSELINKCNFKPEDTVIKMDCEGAEWNMIGNKNDEEIIKLCKLLALEVHNKKGERRIDDFYQWIVNLAGNTHEITVYNHSPTLGVVKAVKGVQ